MPTVRIGLIGCGRIGRGVHIGNLCRLSEVEIVALAEPDRSRRDQALRRVPGAAAFEDYREMLVSAEVDGVVVCVPTSLHAEVALAAVKAGKHIYLEKPLASSLIEAKILVDSWRQSSVAGMIGFNYRFHPLYQAAREQTAAGRIGEVIAVRSVFSTSQTNGPAWQQSRSSGGGALLDLGSHHIDLLEFILRDQIREVFAHLHSREREHDTVALQMRFGDDRVAQSFFSFGGVDEDRFEFFGTGGKLMVDRFRSINVEVTAATEGLSRAAILRRGWNSFFRSPLLLNKMRSPRREISYQVAMGHFVHAIRAHRPTRPDFMDGYCALAVIDAAERSAESGRAVSISDESKAILASESRINDTLT